MKMPRHSIQDILSYATRRTIQGFVRLCPRADKGGMRWRLGVPDEIRFWSRWIETEGGAWHDDFNARLDPERPLIPELAALVDSTQDTVRILDVGAGPITCVGFTHADFQVDVIAVDPLADQYQQMMDEAGVEPPVRTVTAMGEHLLEVVDAGSFDLAYARNALDHAQSPFECIEQMLAAIRPGGSILLQHAVNEGDREKYAGLHQWNFEERTGHLVIWDRSRTLDVTDALGDSVEMQVRQIEVGGEPWVMALIQKPPVPPR